MEKIKYMDLNEFRDQGYLQEVNRIFFHPLGLALDVCINDEGKVEKVGGIWDAREDPEGFHFDGKMLSADKEEIVERQRKKLSKSRLDKLGYEIQPISQLNT